MTDPDTIREILRLMNEDENAMHNPRLNERRIAILLGIAEGKDEGGTRKDEKTRTRCDAPSSSIQNPASAKRAQDLHPTKNQKQETRNQTNP